MHRPWLSRVRVVGHVCLGGHGKTTRIVGPTSLHTRGGIATSLSVQRRYPRLRHRRCISPPQCSSWTSTVVLVCWSRCRSTRLISRKRNVCLRGTTRENVERRINGGFEVASLSRVIFVRSGQTHHNLRTLLMTRSIRGRQGRPWSND